MNAFGEWKVAFSVIQILVAMTAVIGTAMVISRFLLRQRPIARERMWMAALVGVLASPLVVVVNRYAPDAVPALALLSPELLSSDHAARPNAATTMKSPPVENSVENSMVKSPEMDREATKAEFVSPSSEEAPDAISLVGSSRVDLQACKLEYSIVSPK